MSFSPDFPVLSDREAVSKPDDGAASDNGRPADTSDIRRTLLRAPAENLTHSLRVPGACVSE